MIETHERGSTVTTPTIPFQQLVACVRAGDPDAAAALVRDFEPELRRAVRVRLTDPRLRRVLDTADVCQSVLAHFFVRVAAGDFDLERPEQLLRLLVTMARNKVFDKSRRGRADRRDCHRLDPAAAPDDVAGSSPDPARTAAGRDLLEAVRLRLDDAERYLADQRGRGRTWDDLAAELDEDRDALRKRLSRALDRVTAELGLEEIWDA